MICAASLHALFVPGSHLDNIFARTCAYARTGISLRDLQYHCPCYTANLQLPCPNTVTSQQVFLVQQLPHAPQTRLAWGDKSRGRHLKNAALPPETPSLSTLASKRLGLRASVPST